LLEGGPATPAFDLGVIAREQRLGDPHPAELRRARVVRVVQDPVFAERILLVGRPAADDAGPQPPHRLEYAQGRDLPACDDVVADRDLLGREPLHDTLLDALVAAPD